MVESGIGNVIELTTGTRMGRRQDSCVVGLIKHILCLYCLCVLEKGLKFGRSVKGIEKLILRFG